MVGLSDSRDVTGMLNLADSTGRLVLVAVPQQVPAAGSRPSCGRRSSPRPASTRRVHAVRASVAALGPADAITAHGSQRGGATLSVVAARSADGPCRSRLAALERGIATRLAPSRSENPSFLFFLDPRVGGAAGFSPGATRASAGRPAGPVHRGAVFSRVSFRLSVSRRAATSRRWCR